MIDLKLGAAQRFVKEVRRVRAPAIEHLRAQTMSPDHRERLLAFEEEFGGLIIETLSGTLIELSAVWRGETAIWPTDWGNWNGNVPVDVPYVVDGATIGTVDGHDEALLNLYNGDIVSRSGNLYWYYPSAYDLRSWLIKEILCKEVLRVQNARRGFSLAGPEHGFDAVCTAAGITPPSEASDEISSFVVERDLVGWRGHGFSSFTASDDSYGMKLIERMGDCAADFVLCNNTPLPAPDISLLAEARDLPLRRAWTLRRSHDPTATLELRRLGADWALIQCTHSAQHEETLVISSRGRSYSAVLRSTSSSPR